MLTKVSYSMINGAPINVLDYGADLTGTTDSSTAIQNALNTGASEVILPFGKYLLNSVLTIKPNQTMLGEKTNLIIGNSLCGSSTANNTPIITLSNRSTIDGFIFSTQTSAVINGTTTTPVIHPYCITADGTSYTNITNISFLACWRGVVAGAGSAHETMTVNNVVGTVFNTPFYIDQNTDTDRLENIHLNPNYAVYNGVSGNFTVAAIVNYQRTVQNANAFTISRADWLQMQNVFVYGYYRGILLEAGTATVAGSPQIQVSNSGFDGCNYGVVSTSTVNATFDACTFSATQLATETPEDVLITGGGTFQFTGCLFLGSVYNAIDMQGTGSLSVVNCQMFDHLNGVLASSGTLNLETVMFKQAAGTIYDISLSGTVKANIANCRRVNGSNSVVNGINSTTVPTYFENGAQANYYEPLYATGGISSNVSPSTLIANGATNYFVTLPAQNALYLVYASQDASPNGVYRALALVATGSGNATVTSLATNGISIVNSGLQVGVTNSAGGSLYVDFGYVYLYHP